METATALSTEVVAPEERHPALPAGVAAARAWLMPPANMTEALNAAKVLAGSSFVPNDYKNKPGDVLCAIQYGAEIGIPPLQALQGIAVINGRPGIYGDLALAVVLASGTVEDFDEKVTGDGDKMVATCRGRRVGRPTAVEHTFSVADAKTAKLWGKAGPWTTNPKRMLQMRARAFVLRDGWADFMKGLGIREELEDITPPVIDMPRAVATPVPLAAEAPAASAAGGDDPPPGDFITEKQRRGLFAECSKAGKNHAALKDYLGREHGIESTNAIPVGLYDTVLAWAQQPA